MSENLYYHHFSLQVSQIVFLTYMTVLHLIIEMNYLKFNKTHISAISLHKYHKSCSQLFWPHLRLITTVWVEILENSYQRDFSAEVS